MTSSEFKDLLHSLARAWETKDYELAASFFAPDVRYADPLRYAAANRNELLAFFRDDEGLDQLTTWHNIVFDEAQQLGAAEYTFEGSNRYHGLVLIRVAGDKIDRWREYQHISPLEWQEFTAATRF